MSAISRVTSTAQQIQEFPDELFVEGIFRFMTRKDLGNTRLDLVCKRWHAVSRELYQITADVDNLRRVPRAGWSDDSLVSLELRNLRSRVAAIQDAMYLYQERSALLTELSREIEGSLLPFSFAQSTLNSIIYYGSCHQTHWGNCSPTFRLAALVLPLIKLESRSPVITNAFKECASNGNVDFSRGLISTNPKDVVDITTITLIRFNCDIGFGNNLFLHGKRLQDRFLTGCSSGKGDWDETLPLSYKEEITESGEQKKYWETILVGNHFLETSTTENPVIASRFREISIPFKPVIHTDNDRLIWSKGDNYTMKVGETIEITPEFEY